MAGGMKVTGSTIRVTAGEVVIESAEGVILTLSPKAAMQMSDDLNAAAIRAIGERDERR